MVRWAEANCDSYCCEEKYQKKEYFTLLLEMSSGRQNLLNEYVPMWTEGGRELKWRVKCMKRNHIKKPKGFLVALIITLSILSGGISSYTVFAQLNSVYNMVYLATFEGTEEPLEQGNELQEHQGTVEDFAGTKIIEDFSEERPDTHVSFIEFDADNNTTHNISKTEANAGEEIIVALSTEQEDDMPIYVGIASQDEKTSYIIGKGTVLHAFSIAETGTYQVFVMNKSGSKLHVAGTIINGGEIGVKEETEEGGAIGTEEEIE